MKITDSAALSNYRKTGTALVGAAALAAASGTVHGTAEVVLNCILAVATILGVYVTPNTIPRDALPVAQPVAPPTTLG